MNFKKIVGLMKSWLIELDLTDWMVIIGAILLISGIWIICIPGVAAIITGIGLIGWAIQAERGKNGKHR